jgi:hypothetical protein
MVLTGIPHQVRAPQFAFSICHPDTLCTNSMALLICFLNDGNSIFQVCLLPPTVKCHSMVSVLDIPLRHYVGSQQVILFIVLAI